MTFRKFFLFLPLCLLGQSQMDYVKQIKNKPAIDIREMGAKGNGIADDTAAFQSAITQCISGCTISLTSGTYLVSDTITIPSYVTIKGTSIESFAPSSGSVAINFSAVGKPLFNVTGTQVSISDVVLHKTGATATSNTVGIYTKNGFSGGVAANFTLSNLAISNFYNGIIIDGALTGNLTNIQVNNCEADGIVGKGAQGYWNSINSIANKGNGITLTAATAMTSANPFSNGIQTYANGGWGIYAIESINQIHNFFLNNDAFGEFYLNKAGGSPDAGLLTDGIIQFAGDNPFNGSPGYTNSATAQGVLIVSGSLTVDAVSFFRCNGNCVESQYASTKLSNLRIQGSGITSTTGNRYDIKLTGISSQIIGCATVGPIYSSGNFNHISNNIMGNGIAIVTLQIAAGTDVTLSNNFISQGSAGAVQIDSGVTLSSSNNQILGTVTNNGTISIYSKQIVPVPLSAYTVLTLPANPTMASMVWCNDCVANNNACSGSGTGALAVWNTGSGVWICK